MSKFAGAKSLSCENLIANVGKQHSPKLRDRIVQYYLVGVVVVGVVVVSVCIVNVYKVDSLMPSLQVDAFRKNDLNVIEFGSSVCSPNGNSICTSKNYYREITGY